MIQTFDYREEYHRHKDEIDSAIRKVLESGQLILGPQVEAFEAEFAAFVGTRHGVGVKSGTDALTIALRALEISSGEVITVANTAVPTVAAIQAAGATPRFVDVDPHTLLMDPEQLSAAIGPQTRCIIPVHLYGQAAPMHRIGAIANRHGLPLIADCAQAHVGAYLGKIHVGTFADIGCFSFYPTKNLGAFGDAGLCVTSDDRLAARMRQIRMYGFDSERISQYEGFCSRLDELQAAILRVKLRHLHEGLEIRQCLAQVYTRLLRDSHYALPLEATATQHAFHLYVVRAPHREIVIEQLERAQIGYGVHYRVPIHCMPAYEFLGYRRGDLPVTERAADEVLSLPLHPGLTVEDMRTLVRVLLDAVPINV